MRTTVSTHRGGRGRSSRTQSLVARTVALAATAAVALIVGLASPAAAKDLPVSGTFTGTGHFEFACNFAEEFTDGGGDWTSLGSTTFHLVYCVDAPTTVTDPWPVPSGTFTIETADGTVTGEVGGYVQAGTTDPEGRYPYHLVLTVTGGTGRYDGATGNLVLDGSFEYIPFYDRRHQGTVSGTITLPASMPETRDDCRHGGWRDLVDDAGRPFRNQGHCIAFVNHHRRS